MRSTPGYGQADADAVAEAILERARATGILSAADLADALGYRIQRATRDELGGLWGASFGSTILVARARTEARNQWTIGHELVHREIRQNHDGRRDFEDFVDRCVGALLMPAKDVREQLERSRSLPVLCRRYGTSYEATAIRLGEVVGAFAVVADSAASARSLTRNPSDSDVAHATAACAFHALRAGNSVVDGCAGWRIFACVTPGRSRALAVALPPA